MDYPTATDETFRIAVVDDDKDICRLLAGYLERACFEVFTAHSRAEMDSLLARFNVDLVLLDLNLPDSRGLETARHLRSLKSHTGIIIVSGSEDAVDKVLGLEIGADDFISKPFDQRELLARVRAVLRRVAESSRGRGEGRIRFGGFELDLDARELTDEAGNLVTLTSREFALLKIMVCSANRVLHREHILQSVAGRDWIYSDRSVDVMVTKLRRKIEEDPAHPRFIKTVRGAGYKFTVAA
ncbi:MAG: response regulator [Pseudomonadota bacterium]